MCSTTQLDSHLRPWSQLVSPQTKHTLTDDTPTWSQGVTRIKAIGLARGWELMFSELPESPSFPWERCLGAVCLITKSPGVIASAMRENWWGWTTAEKRRPLGSVSASPCWLNHCVSFDNNKEGVLVPGFIQVSIFVPYPQMRKREAADGEPAAEGRFETGWFGKAQRWKRVKPHWDCSERIDRQAASWKPCRGCRRVKGTLEVVTLPASPSFLVRSQPHGSPDVLSVVASFTGGPCLKELRHSREEMAWGMSSRKGSLCWHCKGCPPWGLRQQPSANPAFSMLANGYEVKEPHILQDLMGAGGPAFLA